MTVWEGQRYDAVGKPHEGWGQRIDSLALSGDEAVVDVGCGTGRDVASVLPRLPRGRVVAVDASVSMLEQVRSRVGDDARVTLVQADLHEPLPLTAGSFDTVMSVAALHWLRDHERVWAHLAALLAPGGRLAVECGAAGNIASIIQAVVDVAGADGVPLWTFAGVEDTAARLEAADFVDIEVTTRSAPVRFPDRAQFITYLRTVALHALPIAVLEEIASRLDAPVVDYVRLEVRARARTTGGGTVAPFRHAVRLRGSGRPDHPRAEHRLDGGLQGHAPASRCGPIHRPAPRAPRRPRDDGEGCGRGLRVNSS